METDRRTAVRRFNVRCLHVRVSLQNYNILSAPTRATVHWKRYLNVKSPISGWGSGASLVSLLMASPLTQPGRRLFRRAILLDGTALAPWAMAHNPQQYYFQVAENLGVRLNELLWSSSCLVLLIQFHWFQCISRNRSSIYNDNVDTTLRCMQDHSADNVTKAVQAISIPTFLSGFAPIVDGQVRNHWKATSFAQNVVPFAKLRLRPEPGCNLLSKDSPLTTKSPTHPRWPNHRQGRKGLVVLGGTRSSNLNWCTRRATPPSFSLCAPWPSHWKKKKITLNLQTFATSCLTSVGLKSFGSNTVNYLLQKGSFLKNM